MTKTEELAYTSRTTGWRGTPQAGKPSPATVRRGILTATLRGASDLSLERRKMEREDYVCRSSEAIDRIVDVVDRLAQARSVTGAPPPVFTSNPFENGGALNV